MIADWKEMLASVYGVGVDIKNFVFDTGLMDAVRIPTSILSVGNLSMGGTGKTPVVQWILQVAQERGLNPTVVARNYRARSTGIHHLDVFRPDGAAYYGDEAFLIAEKFPKLAVWTGPKKYLTAQASFRSQPTRLMVVDDGFQHRSLHRDFDLVLIDAMASSSEDFLFPQGRLRERFASLRRSHMIGITRANWAAEARLSEIRSQLATGIPVYEIDFFYKASKPFSEQDQILAVSGIARPETFDRTVQEILGKKPQAHMIFRDHFDFGGSDVEKILREFKHLNCNQIFTTEKDFVKLQNFPAIREHLNPVQISICFREAPRELYEFFDRNRRP
jgi:tetraacyldisaccharide 4'-kinase